MSEQIDSRIAERTESMLDRLNRRIHETLDELRAEGEENGPGLESSWERSRIPPGTLTEEEWDKWWEEERERRRLRGPRR